MPSSHAVLAFGLTSLLLVLIPGPSVMFVVGRSLSYGRRGGLVSVLGNELGALVLVAAVALGVGSVVAESAAVFAVVKLCGAGYLALLGVQALRHRKDMPSADSAIAVTDAAAPTMMLRQGLLVGVSNPKTIVFFVAALPQFVDAGRATVPLQMMVLGLEFVVIALVCDSVWALLASSARSWFARSPRRLERVRATGGILMIGLGATLAVARDSG